jgi:hypothetical protein
MTDNCPVMAPVQDVVSCITAGMAPTRTHLGG